MWRSPSASARALLEVVRAHWSVENQLHWPLDVVFDEDDARSRKTHAPENLAVLRRLALNMLRAHPSDLYQVSLMITDEPIGAVRST